MGKIRTNSTSDFPVESRSNDISYVLIPGEPVEVKRFKKTDSGGEPFLQEQTFKHFKSTKSDKERLLSRLNDLEDRESADLLGVWPGEWRTDVHHLCIPEFIQRLEDAEL